MTALDINAFETALTAALEVVAGSTGVFNRIAPPDQAYPFVVFHQQSDVTEYVYTARAWDDLTYMIKAITRGDSTADANKMAKSIETILTDNELSLAEGTTLYLRKTSGIAYPELAEGERFNHAGGLYRIWLG